MSQDVDKEIWAWFQERGAELATALERVAILFSEELMAELQDMVYPTFTTRPIPIFPD